MNRDEILKWFESQANPDGVAGMARFGIRPGVKVYGVSIPALRSLGKQIGRNHALAAELWQSGVHEGRLLACFIADPRQMTEAQMERWVADLDSWDICDQCCLNLFRRTPFAYKKVEAWTARDEEFTRRAGFVLMATLAVHEKKAGDDVFERFLSIIKRGATDPRNFVKKAVNWALRQIGKRNLALNEKAIQAAKDIQTIDSKAARWIAADALRELAGEKVQQKLRT